MGYNRDATAHRRRYMAVATEDVIAEMVERIVREVDPERVYLFGSRARGDAREDSDVDLLVVQREEPGVELDTYRQEVRLWEALSQFRVAKDILVYPAAEVERRRKWLNHVIAHALREGRLLYERP